MNKIFKNVKIHQVVYFPEAPTMSYDLSISIANSKSEN